jgi:hypothetical protein
MVPAQAPGGLSCFLVPRVLDDGAHNHFEVLRLKDKTMHASLLTRFARAYVSEAFVASRLAGAHGHTFGTMPHDLVEASADKVIERAFPR